MKFILNKFLFLFILTVFVFCSSNEILAQSCGGSATCVLEYDIEFCSTGGGSYSPEECALYNGTWTTRTVSETTSGSCIPLSTYCEGSCPTRGTGGGGCVFRPPEVPAQPQDMTPVIDEETPPTETKYACTAGYCYESDTGSFASYYQCLVNCGRPLTTGEPPPDPKAGLSSCSDILDNGMVSQAIVYPGGTEMWQTWDAPPGATPNDRLLGQSPLTMRTMSFTSPSDKATITATFHEPETPPVAFYILNDRDKDEAKTWWFYQGDNLPPIIFSGSNEIINQAKEIGYKLTEPNGIYAPTSEKLIFKTPDDFGDNWSSQLLGEVPRGQHIIPYVSCASSLGASDHNYFKLSSTLIDNQLVCNPRGDYIQINYDPDPNNTSHWHNTGSYLGLEKDFPYTWSSRGTDKYIPERRYWDDLQFILNPKKLGGQMEWRNGYYRNVFIQIPTQTLWQSYDPPKPDDNPLYLFIRTAANADPFQPVKSKTSSDACLLKATPTKIAGVPASGEDTKGSCSTLRVTDVTDPYRPQVVYDNPTKILHPGTTYKLSLDKVNNDTHFYPFFNQNFAQSTDASELEKGWKKDNDIELMEVVNCQSSGVGCWTGVSDEKNILKFAKKASAPGNRGWVFPEYFDVLNEKEAASLTGQTIYISFWAKSATETNSLPEIKARRWPVNGEGPYYDLNFDIPDDVIDFYYLNRETSSNQKNIPLTNEWRYFTVVGTFKKTHILDSDTSKFYFAVRPPSDGSVAYLDNFSVSGTKEPVVTISMRKANQCSAANTITALALPDESGQNFSSTVTIPSNASGQYDIFTRQETGFGGGCFGHPLYTAGTNTCGVNAPAYSSVGASNLDTSITGKCDESCNTKVTVEACSTTVPPIPTVGHRRDYCEDGTYDITLGNIPTTNVGDIKAEIVVYQQEKDLDWALAEPNTSLEVIKDIKTVPTGANAVTFTVTATKDIGSFAHIAARLINTSCENTYESPWAHADKDLECEVAPSVLMVNSNVCNAGDPPNTEIYKVPYPDINQANVTYTWSNMNPDDKNGTSGPWALDPGGVISGIQPLIPYKNVPSWPGNISARLVITNGSDELNSYECAPCNKDGDNPYQCIQPVSILSLYSPGSVKFYVMKTNTRYDSWWHTIGGLIFGNEKVSTPLPYFNASTVNAYCKYYDDDLSNWCENNLYINANSENSASKKSGIPISNGSIQSLKAEAGSWWTHRSSTKTGATSAGVNVASDQEKADYNYFYQLLDLQTTEVNSRNTAVFHDDLQQGEIKNFPDGESSKTVYVHHLKPNSGSTVTITFGQDGNPWNITANEKYIILVDGNVKIQGSVETAGKDLININPGGFLMVVASGNITFDKNIGHSFTVNQLTDLIAARNPLVQGIFIASNNLIVESYDSSDGSTPADRKFVGGGTFVGWNDVDLQRKFDDGDIGRQKNAVSPTEQFFFRPDIVANTPEAIKTPNLTWKEAN